MNELTNKVSILDTFVKYVKVKLTFNEQSYQKKDFKKLASFFFNSCIKLLKR